MKSKGRLALLASAAALVITFLGLTDESDAAKPKGKEVGFTRQANGDLAIENPGHEFLFRNASSFHVNVDGAGIEAGASGACIGLEIGGFCAAPDGFLYAMAQSGGLTIFPTGEFDLMGFASGAGFGIKSKAEDIRVGGFSEEGDFVKGFRLSEHGAGLENGGSVFQLGNDGIIRLTHGPQTAALGFGVEADPDHFRINAEETILDAQAISLIGGEGGGGLFINRDGSLQLGGSSLHARVDSPAGPNGFDVEDHGMAKFGNALGGITVHADGALTAENPRARFLIDSMGRFELFTPNGAGWRNGLKTIDTGNVLLGQFENDGNFRNGLDVDVAGNGTYRGPSFHVAGTFSTSGPKPFRIPHPLQPKSELWHAAIESPQPMNVYSGNVVTNRRGFAVVRLPAYFDAINRDFRYQLTVVGRSFARAVVWREIAGNRFTIRTDRPSVKVSWQVTAVRDDTYMRAHPFQTERKAK